MADTPESPAPAAPAAPAPAAAPAAAPSPAARPEINVSTLMRNDAPAKPGSARDKMNQRLREKAGVKPAAEPPKPVEAPAGEPPKPAEGAEPTPAAGGEPAIDPKTGKPPKVNPWKLVDEYKAKAAKLEADQVELSKRAISKVEWDQKVSEADAVKKRNQELEDHIRYVDYSKSKEFQEKYQTPYEAAWKRTMGDFKDVMVDDNGNQRPIQATDMLALVNMPLQRAREAAEQMFGSLANDVMANRNEIRRLYDDQSAALDKARTEGSARDKQRMEQFQSQQKEMQKTITEGWTKANEKAVADPAVGRFLKPVEGDVEWNTRLEKATKLADQAFSENPMAHGLTPDQRNEIIERHSAIRNRAIAYSLLRHENTKLDARVKELEAKLKPYEQAEPPAAGSVRAPAGELKGFDRIRQGLQKIARPG